jgi:hypothetical protein
MAGQVSAVVDKIRSRGAWDVTIRPASFVPNRIPYQDLDEVLEKVLVRMRGWPVPYMDAHQPFQRGEDWIGQEIEAQVTQHYEAWRFFTSGQFNHLRAVSADWRVHMDTMSTTAVPEGADSVIEVWEILYYLTEVFELAARLALKMAGADEMTVRARLNGLQNRALVVGQPNRVPFMEPYIATLSSLEQSVTIRRDVLIADARSEAAKLSQQFFLRFGWKVSLEQLMDHQRELTDEPRRS